MIVKNWFELIKQAGISPVVVHDEEQYPAELVRLCELVAADAEAREQAALRLLDQNRAISEDNFTKLNGWMHACLAAESQRDALLADVDRCYKMLLTEPDTQGALFKAENILREAIAGAKGGAA